MQTGTTHPFGSDAEPTEYLVKKQTVARIKCKSCGGSGLNRRGYKCTDCIEGVTTMKHTAEVDLMTALRELNLIKNQ